MIIFVWADLQWVSGHISFRTTLGHFLSFAETSLYNPTTMVRASFYFMATKLYIIQKKNLKLECEGYHDISCFLRCVSVLSSKALKSRFKVFLPTNFSLQTSTVSIYLRILVKSFSISDQYRIGLTSHLGDSGMKNRPTMCTRDGTAPESKGN